MQNPPSGQPRRPHLMVQSPHPAVRHGRHHNALGFPSIEQAPGNRLAGGKPAPLFIKQDHWHSQLAGRCAASINTARKCRLPALINPAPAKPACRPPAECRPRRSADSARRIVIVACRCGNDRSDRSPPEWSTRSPDRCRTVASMHARANPSPSVALTEPPPPQCPNHTAQSHHDRVAQASCLHRNRGQSRLEACATNNLALYC